MQRLWGLSHAGLWDSVHGEIEGQFSEELHFELSTWDKTALNRLHLCQGHGFESASQAPDTEHS